MTQTTETATITNCCAKNGNWEVWGLAHNLGLPGAVEGALPNGVSLSV